MFSILQLRASKSIRVSQGRILSVIHRSLCYYRAIDAFFFNARIYHLQMRYFRSPNSLLRARSGASLLYFHSDKPLNDITVYAHQMQLVQSNRYVRMCIHVVLTLLAALATVVIFVIYYDGLSVGESCSPTKSFARRINSYGA